MTKRSPCYALLALLAVVGCKSSETSDAGPSDGAVDSTELCGDAAPCTTSQLCVSHQNCATPACTPVPANGMCPAGTSATSSCPDGGPAGCIAGCPATYSCRARPAGCATLACSCATSLCTPDRCIAATGDRVACGPP